jgi:thiol-disulfide isomerase/thioredoxin
MKKWMLLCLLITVSVFAQQPKQFSEKALQDVFLNTQEQEITFSEILNTYTGKTIIIDVWAGWCKDCVGGLPKVKKLQNKHPDIVYLFLSLDKTPKSWKNAIKVLDIKGAHYFIKSGWKGDFCSAINLDWIPRYMVINPAGEIALFKAIEADDERIEKLLQEM